MSIVIVIAPSEHTAQTAWASLHRAGLATAQPSRREQLAPQQVQALMLKTTQQRRSPQSAALDKIWTELATDLALGNVDVPRCGWWQTLDPHTPTFWQRFDPDTRFVLVYEEPTAQTAKALTETLQGDATPNGSTAPDVDGPLQTWHDQHSQLLDTFFALGDQALLVHASQLAQAAQWLGLRIEAANASGTASSSILLHYLLQPLVAARPAVQTLWPQLQAAAQGPCADPAPEQQAAMQAVVDWLQQQSRFQATTLQIDHLTGRCEALQVRHSELSAALQAEAKCQADLQAQLAAETQAKQAEAEAKAEAQKQRDELVKAKSELQTRLEAEIKGKQAEAAAKAAAEQQIQTLQQAQEQHKRQLQEAQEEGELLLAQLHQVQEELEQYFIKYQEQRKQYQTVADFWRQQPPAEIWVDMRRTPDGAGWYEAEADGRWSGPATESTVALPPLTAGDYLLELHIADAMAPELVAGLQLTAVLDNGLNESVTVPVELVHEFGPAQNLYPMVSTGLLALPATQAGWQLRLTLPEVISPAAHGGTDTRHLGLRLQGLRLSQHTQATEDTEAQA